MTRETLDKLIAMGLNLGTEFDSLADTLEISRKNDADNAKITDIQVKTDNQKDDNNKYFIVRVTLSTNAYLGKVELEIDGKIFQGFQKSDVFELFAFYANVYVDFSSIMYQEENFKLTAKLIDYAGKNRDTKNINVKVKNDGKVSKTDEKTEVIRPKTEVNNSIDIDYFIENYISNFGKITDSQENSITNVLKGVEKYYSTENKKIDKFHLAYMLATIKHETGSTFNPVEEANWLKWKSRKSYFEKMYDPILGNPEKRKKMAIENGNTKKGDGVKYYGRGYVQITWKNNYKKMQDKFGVDLVNYPSLALENELAMNILIYGSETGFFTGNKLDKYINSKKKDYYNARKVINGLDKAKTIEEYANKIEKCIKFIV